MIKKNSKPERYSKDKKPLVHSEPVRSSTVSNSSISRMEKKIEKERLENRGIF